MDATDYADTTREELLLLAAELILVIGLGNTPAPELVARAERLARLFLTFDDWLARGGNLPREWRRS